MPNPSRLAALGLAAVAAAMPLQPAGAAGGVTYACTFAEGDAFSFEGKAFARAAVNPLEMRISDVVAGSETAQLEAPSGKAPLKVVQALGARHFLEVAVEGYLVITTIYETEAADGGFAAVHSRHLAVVGEPFVAQYRGTCKATQ